MTDEPPIEEASGDKEVIDKFPFFLVLVSMFVNGALFCVLNGPVMYLWLKGGHFSTVKDLYCQGILPFWSAIIHSSVGVFPVSAMVMGCLLVGLLLTPFDRLNMVVWTAGTNCLRRKHVFFSLSEMTRKNYVAFISALVLHKPYKLHWEWDLFLTHLQWNIVTNFIVYGCIELLVVNGPDGLGRVALKLIIVVVFLIPALMRSRHMCRVQSYYMHRFKIKPDSEGDKAE